jgi:hypothetical protein
MKYRVPVTSHSKIYHIIEFFIKINIDYYVSEYENGIKIKQGYIIKKMCLPKGIDTLISSCPFTKAQNVYSKPFPKIFYESFIYSGARIAINEYDFNTLKSQLFMMNGYKLKIPNKDHMFYKIIEVSLPSTTIYVNAEKIDDYITYSTISANPDDIADDKFDDDIRNAKYGIFLTGIITIAGVFSLIIL